MTIIIRIFQPPPKPNPPRVISRPIPPARVPCLHHSSSSFIPLFPSFLVASIPPIPLPNDYPHSLFHLWQCARRQRTHLPRTGRILHTTDPNGPHHHPTIAKRPPTRRYRPSQPHQPSNHPNLRTPFYGRCSCVVGCAGGPNEIGAGEGVG